MSDADEATMVQQSNTIVDKLAAVVGPAGLDGLTRDEAASINVYTQETPNIYKALNRMLLKGDRDPLKQWFPYLKLFLTALHKLPSCPGTYFRGVSADIASQYIEGRNLVWWALSSSTATIAALEDFMEPGEPRVLFSLEVQRVVNINKFSTFAGDEVADGVGEDERLLICGIPLKVKSKMAMGGNLTMVQMAEELGGPPLVPGFTLKPPPPWEIDPKEIKFDKEKDEDGDTVKIELGSGSFGRVYAGTFKENKVAIKQLPSGSEEIIKAFRKEAGITFQLRHRNVARCYGGAIKEENVQLIFERLEASLHSDLHTTKVEMSAKIVRDTILQVAHGLAYLHQNKVSHRDLKPENVMRNATGVWKLIDFGLANSRSSSMGSKSSVSGANRGTAGYMAPELYAGGGNHTVDTYAFGMLAYETVMRSRPFTGLLGADVVRREVEGGGRPDLVGTHPNFSNGLPEIIEACWHQNPESRPDMLSVAASLMNGAGGGLSIPTEVNGAASQEPQVDILVIVDYPTHGGGGGSIEPAKYIAPFHALKAAIDAKFLGTQARIRFHTPRSVIDDDQDLLKQRLSCVCWIAMGEEASAAEDLTFTTSLWKACGGRCDFAIVLMKHGGEHISGALLDKGCADRVLWVSADYTDTQKTNEFLADGKTNTAAIPGVMHSALVTGAAFNTERAAQRCCSLVLNLAKKRGVDAGVQIHERCREIPQVTEGDKSQTDDIGISLSRTPSDPAELTHTIVGVPRHSSVDLNEWPQTCDLLQILNKGRNTLGVVAVTGGTDVGRKVVAWTAVQSYIAVADRFTLVVYRDVDLLASSEQGPETFDLPFETHGDQDVLVWMDSRGEFPFEALRKAIDSSVDSSLPFPWTFLLTSKSDFDDVSDEFEGATEILLQRAIGTTVNESSEDLICILPVDPTLKLKSILEVIDAAKLLVLLAAALPQVASETLFDRGASDYIDQIVIGDGNSVVVRGMAPNTKFLFELRNDLIDGALDQRINALLLGFVENASDLGGQLWTLDKSAFVGIYPKILSQMDQLSPHQRAKLGECEVAQRAHVTGPAGCGKTFIALHMVVDMIEAAELASGTLTRESPILFVGKNEALCSFFVNWILQRLRKKKTTKAAKALLSAYIKVLHTSPFEDNVFGLEFGTRGKMNFVEEGVSSTHSLVIVDEAHHIFAAGTDGDDAARVSGLCMEASRSLLLSDISQGETAATVIFPPDHKNVVLTEVVRNSSRIVTASLPFCRTADLTDVTCSHGVRGPPLEPFVFANCRTDASLRYERYVEGVMHGLQHMMETFPGAEMHDNLVILVPNEEFKASLLPLLTSSAGDQIPEPGIVFVDAVDGAFSEPKRNARVPSRVVLDTLESFDGMERLFVFAVGLDSVKTTGGCCGIYRAITRAHMFVCVVQEHLKGGWLEFTAAVECDDLVDFDEKKERERVARANLAVIARSDAAAAARIAGNDDVGSGLGDGDGEIIAVPLPATHDADHNGDDDDLYDEIGEDEDGPALVINTGVWATNLNSEAFNADATISALSFDPFSSHASTHSPAPPPTLPKRPPKVGLPTTPALEMKLFQVCIHEDEPCCLTDKLHVFP